MGTVFPGAATGHLLLSPDGQRASSRDLHPHAQVCSSRLGIAAGSSWAMPRDQKQTGSLLVVLVSFLICLIPAPTL